MITAEQYIHLSHLGLLRIQGEQAGTFLQGQLTCDVNAITDQSCQLAAFCNHQARIIALLKIFKWNSDFYALLPHEILKNTQEHLQKYAALSKVDVTDVSEDFYIIGILHPTSSPFIQQKKQIQLHYIGSFPHAIRIQATDMALPDPLQPVSLWELSDLQVGIPELYSTTINTFNPHDLNLVEQGAVSFNKGCYVGQEIIARMQHLGKRKQRLYQGQVKSEMHLSPGEKIYNTREEIVGTLVNACVFKDNEYRILAVVKDSAVQETACQLSHQQQIHWRDPISLSKKT